MIHYLISGLSLIIDRLKPNDTLFNIGLKLFISSPTSIFLMLGFSLPIEIFTARLKQKCVIYIKPNLYIFYAGL